MWLDKIPSYLWFICANHKLGCSTCTISLGVDVAKNIHLSHEWQSKFPPESFSKDLFFDNFLIEFISIHTSSIEFS